MTYRRNLLVIIVLLSVACSEQDSTFPSTTPPDSIAEILATDPNAVDWALVKENWEELSDAERDAYGELSRRQRIRAVGRVPADECANTSPEIGTLPYNVNGDTQPLVDNYFLAGEPGSCAGGGSQYSGTGVGPDEVWQIRVDVNCSLRVSMTGLSDMNITIVTDCADLDDTCLGVDDAAGGGGTEDVYFDAVAGTDYFIIVDGYNGGANTYDMTISEDGTSTGCELIGNACDGTNDGLPCDDGIDCTVNDTCTLGTCVGTPDDGQCDDEDPCTADTCDGTMCVATPISGPVCDDGNPCTDDVCNSGVCEGTNDDTNTCSDGNVCTSDVCVSGVCQGTPKDCSALDSSCRQGTCNTSTGFCEALPANEAGMCDDGDACTSSDACTLGECGGSPVDCSGLDNLCDVGVCNASSGACETAPKDCSGLDGPCTLGMCNGTTGNCESAPLADGTMCDDGVPCTLDDVCGGGVCDGTPRDCSNDCNAGSCFPLTGACILNPINEAGSCDDGNPCTTGDSCTLGTCAGQPMDCTAFDSSCSVGVCNPATVMCEAQPINEAESCDDGDPCTESDACSAGMCVGSARDCSPLDSPCSVGVCEAGSGLCAAMVLNDGMPCDDGDACTTGDTCVEGVCGGDNTCLDGPIGGNESVTGTQRVQGTGCAAVAGTNPIWLAGLVILGLRRRRR